MFSCYSRPWVFSFYIVGHGCLSSLCDCCFKEIAVLCNSKIKKLKINSYIANFLRYGF